MPGINVIAIVAGNGAIGINGDQPFHIRDDFKHFKQLTLGHPIIMGRRTFEALPTGALPGRRNIVVTRRSDWHADGVETAPSLQGAVVLACESDEQMFVIGGGEIYRQAIDIADRLYITHVESDVADADTFFPAIDPEKWLPAETSASMTDAATGLIFRFVRYDRK